jgi:hypothetical protein
MGSRQDIVHFDEYIVKASRNIEQQRRVLALTHNPRTIARAQNLLDLLTVLRANAQHQSALLRGKIRGSR